MARAQNITVFVTTFLRDLTSKTHKFFNMHPFPVRPPPNERGDAGGSIGGSLAENGCTSKNVCAFEVTIVKFLLPPVSNYNLTKLSPIIIVHYILLFNSPRVRSIVRLLSTPS